MLCLLHACYWLTCYPPDSPTAIIGLTHSHHRPHPQPLPASPPATTGLTPNPSPRGEGSDMLCLLQACYWLTCYPLASPHPLQASPPTPLQGERGVICVIYYTLVICQLVNSLTTRPLPNHLVFLLTWHLANCPFVHFSAIFLTRKVPFLSTNCSPCRKNSILAEVCFKAKRS